MKITQEFQVRQGMDVVWASFQDIPSVAQCLPGANLTGRKGPDTYLGTVAVKLGPMTPQFEGEATITADQAARTGTINGTGADRRGGSRGQVVVVYRLAEQQSGVTTVGIDADVTLSGAAAQFGRTSVMNEIAGRLIGEFARCLEAKMSAATPEARASIQAQEVKGFSLFVASLTAVLRPAAATAGKQLQRLFAALVAGVRQLLARRKR